MYVSLLHIVVWNFPVKQPPKKLLVDQAIPGVSEIIDRLVQKFHGRIPEDVTEPLIEAGQNTFRSDLNNANRGLIKGELLALATLKELARHQRAVFLPFQFSAIGIKNERPMVNNDPATGNQNKAYPDQDGLHCLAPLLSDFDLQWN